MNATPHDGPDNAPDDGPEGDGRDDEESTARQAYASMRYLVLESNNRRQAVTEALGGLSFGRTRALRRLLDGPLRMSELAASLATDKPYATLIVDDLERRGLVERTVDPDDRRCRRASLTGPGREAARTAHRIVSQLPSGFARLEPDELSELARLLAKAAGPEAGSWPGGAEGMRRH